MDKITEPYSTEATSNKDIDKMFDLSCKRKRKLCKRGNNKQKREDGDGNLLSEASNINFYILVFLFIRKLHQIHFVFLLIVLGYQSLFSSSSSLSSQDLISIAGKEFTSHRIYILSLFIFSLVLSLVFIFGSEIY